MKLRVLVLVALAFAAGYYACYYHSYRPLHDKLQAIQAEDWEFWNKLPANKP